jgi:Lon protease-like protein
MELPLFALHAAVFPGQTIALRVFEERYLAMMEDVLPEGSFAIAAIRRGAEVGGPADPYRIGVAATVDDYALDDDGTYALSVRAGVRLSLIRRSADHPYPRWEVAALDEVVDATRGDVEVAEASLLAYLEAIGEPERPALPRGALPASFVVAAATPGLTADRQALLETPSAGERLRAAAGRLRDEARLVRAVGAAATGVGHVTSLN